MNIVIDLELEAVITDFNNRVEIGTIEVKSQDTPIMVVYFVQRGTVFDLGTSPGIRFGLFLPGNPNSLVLCSTFTRTTDATNRTCYRGYPNFNTVPLTAALGQNTTLPCLGEWRYQTSGGTITRTQNVNFSILRVLLSETILDNTTAAFTTPAVNANVTIAITSTGWLNSGQILSIGAGAGNYTVVSITDGTHFVAQNNGGTGNAAPGTVIPSGTSVGIAPVTVLSTYPDPSIIELTTHKGAANGYASLDANTLLLAARVPVDTQTIVANANGKIALSSVLATVGANFTTVASGATVSVTLSGTGSLIAGMYVRIPIAGYYIVNSITDSTHAVLQNNGDPFNAASGVTITTGAVLLPAQAAAGGGGTAGQNAFTTLLAGFIVPASGATVSVNLGSTAWLGGSGYVVFIAGAGYYAVSSITDATHAVLTNLGYAATNAIAGTSIPLGAAVSPGGLQGPASTLAGANAYDTTQASFTMPAAAASVNVTITNTNWLGVGQEVYITGAGYFSVASITSPTVFNATNSNYPGAAAPGTTIASGAHVSPAGPIGPQGAGGPGLNAFTTLTSNFTQPAVGNPVTIVVGTTAWMVATEVIYIAGGGYYQISSVGDLTHVTVTNLGYAGNAAPAATVTGSGTQGVSPGGLIGPNGTNAYTTTTAAFTTPAVGGNVTIAVGSTAWIAQNQGVFISGAGYYQVVSVGSSTALTIQNMGATGNVVSGTVVNSGAPVSAGGAIGPAGPVGPTGATGGIGEAPTDGQIYGRQSSAWTPVTSGGGSSDPESGILWAEHFTTPYSLPGGAGSLNMDLPWQSQGQGTFAPTSYTGALMTSGPELSAIGLGTSSATAIIDLTIGSYANGYNFCVPIGLGIATWKCKIAVDALITSTDALVNSIGLFRYNTFQGFYGGFFFEYNYAVSANWRCCVRTGNASNATYVDSGVAVAANTWVKFKVVTNAAWTSFVFYINNTLVATITTNVPTASNDLGVAPHFLQVRSAYTNLRQIYTGYFYLNYPFTN